MRFKIQRALSVFLFLACGPVALAQTNLLRVEATFKAGNKGIPDAVITSLPGNTLLTITDSAGRFLLMLPPGENALLLTHPDYQALSLSFQLRRDTVLMLRGITSALNPSGTNTLREVSVTANSNRQRLESTQMGLEIVDRKTALTLPAILGEVDIIKVFQLKPGVKNNGEGTSGISVRGGGTDQNLFLFDGTPVYNPSHLFGFFSTFNIDAVKDVQLYKAGFPAEYSGRLSSIVAVNSLRGTDTPFSVAGGIGLIASRLNMQGNVLHKNKKGKKLTYNFAARRTYADVFTRALNRANEGDPTYNQIPDYYFWDANARIDYVPNDRDAFYASLYYGRDYFKLSRATFGSTFSWGNTAASLHWRRRMGENLTSELSVHLADYNYALESAFDRFDFRLGSGVREYFLAHKFTYRGLQNHKLSVGYQVGHTIFSVARLNVGSTRADENLSSGESPEGSEAGFFVADEWDVTPKLSINGGARFTLFRNGTTYSGLEPRISVRQLLGNNGLALKASYARMQQYKHLVASSGASLPTDIWYPSTARIRPEISDQVSLGFTKTFGQKYILTSEGYYKWMRQLVDYKPGASLLVNSSLEDEFVFGTGRSYGAEITVEKTDGKLRGWIGYTLAWTTRQFEAINNGKPFFPRFDRRHEITAVATYPLRPRITLSASWTFYTGNAVTLPTGRTIGVDAPGTTSSTTLFSLSPVYSERGNYRMPDYHRLDLGIVYKLRPKRGSSDLTFSAYNAYSRLNPYFISFEAKNNSTGIMGTPGGYAPKAITLFPIIPSITYNFRF